MRKQERDRIKARRDGLVARVRELERLLKLTAAELPIDDALYGLKWDISTTLNRQPRQSLDLLRAEVLEWAIKDDLDDHCCDDWERGYLAAMQVIERAATKLRNKAEQS